MHTKDLISGEYAAFLDQKTLELVGGCIWWNVDEKDAKKFWTSHWWLFKDIRDIKVDFYKITEDKLELLTQKKATLNISHNIRLGKECKGSIAFVCN